MLRTFEYYSLAYLNQWYERDRRYVEGLRTQNQELKLNILKEAATFYRIARTLRPRRSFDANRYEALLAILDEIDDRVSLLEMENFIGKVNENLTAEYGTHSLLSATTKFLWLKLQSPVYIYDSLTVAALKVKKNHLHEFRNAWRQSYDSERKSIRAACGNLTNVHKYSSGGKLDREYTEYLSVQPWFWERVHDLYLMDLGRANIRNKLNGA